MVDPALSLKRATKQAAPVDFRRLFESAPGLYLVLTPDLDIVAVSDSYLRATMTQREDILGCPLFDVFPDNPDDPSATGVKHLSASLSRVRKNLVPDTMAIQKYDIRRPASEGGEFEERFWSPVSYPILGENGQLQYIIHQVEDVTEVVRLKQNREEAGAAIARSEQRFRELLEAAPDAIMEVDSQGRIILFNQAALTMFQYSAEELPGETVENLIAPPAQRAAHRQHRAEYARHPSVRTMGSGLELSAQRKDGSVFPVEISLSPYRVDGEMNVIATIRDITRRKKAESALQRSEEKLRQAQKLEALARLSGGTAHEFNNLLTMVMGYAVLMLSSLDSPKTLIDYVEKIRKATTRAGNLTRQLLAFSRQQVLEPQVMDLNMVLAEAWEILPLLVGPSIRARLVPAPEAACVRADPSQIHQIMVNLATNARDAMPRGGELTIEVANVELKQEELTEAPGKEPGPYVALSVTDTGTGMPREVQARLFEPFFSTKEFGKGSGLGLAAVYGIVQQSNGSITVQSSPGEGTAFRILLPRLRKEELLPLPSRNPRPPSEIRGGNETILLVEDQIHLLALTREFLEKLGYTVLTASHADEAIKVAGEFAGRVDLLLTDVVMPGVNGREMANMLKPLRPTMKVLYVSGYTQGVFLKSGELLPHEAFLDKPVAPEELAQKIREMLDAPDEAGRKQMVQ